MVEGMGLSTLRLGLLLAAVGCLPDPPPPQDPLGASVSAYDAAAVDVAPPHPSPGFGAEALITAWLGSLDRPADFDAVFARAGLDPALGRGVTPTDLGPLLRALGQTSADTTVPERDLGALELAFARLHADLLLGRPSLVWLRSGVAGAAPARFVLVTGYAPRTDEVVLVDPEAGALRLDRKTFLGAWPEKGDTTWTLRRTPLDPATLRWAPVPATDGPSPAALARVARKMRAQGGPEFTVKVIGPWVVAGDEASAQVDQRAARTVAWAHRRLRERFFEKDPTEPVPVWIFRDADSYDRHVEAWLGRTPHTPYGFADPSGLYMNIDTGGGTLVHEMVHPLMWANFPKAPPWYNEGLASLFEAAMERDGVIAGMLNWRLPTLEAAIERGRLLPFDALLGMDAAVFYDQRISGTNYAQARYLLYHLQEEGKLLAFHRAFRANVAWDPSGEATLKAVLGERDLRAFQRRWERAALAWEWTGR